jgi:WD40 repeat protein
MSVAISPDVSMIASTGSVDKTIRLWDWKSGACLQVIKPDKNLFPTSSAFSPDGLRLAIYIYRLTGVHAAPTAE